MANRALLAVALLASLLVASGAQAPAAAPANATANSTEPIKYANETTAADAAAIEKDIDISSIPKIKVSEPVTAAAASTSVGGKQGGKKLPEKDLPLDDFKPVWPKDKQINPEEDNIFNIVTDSPLETVKANQIPLIQSLGAALGVTPDQVYWFKILQGGPLLTVYFAVDNDSPDAKARTLGNLANVDNTAKFYANADAYAVNILNGPEVPPDELQLSSDVISTPDTVTAYDGDTGKITNNVTDVTVGGNAKSSASMPGSVAAAVVAGLAAAAMLLVA